MNESSAIIPLPPEDEAVSELIQSKRNYSQLQLVLMPLAELKRLQREWFDWAQRLNLVIIVKLVCKQAGTLNEERGRATWQMNNGAGLIAASLDTQSNAVEVRVDGALVCSDVAIGEEIFVPGQWVITVADRFRQMEIEKARRQESDEARKRQTLIERLGANV